MDYDSDSYFSAEDTRSVGSHSEALIEATAAFDLRGVLKILEAGIDPNEPLEDGITALHIAANSEGNKVYVMQALLDYEADPNIQSHEGVTPLHVAATWGKLEAIKLLLANNADPRVSDLSGKSPLDCCNEMRHKGCALYLREILQGKSIPRSVADVFDEMDFESYHSQLINQTEDLSDNYLPAILPDSIPKLKTSKLSTKERRNRSSPPLGLDSSDEQFLSEISQVLRSNLVADREYEEHTRKPEPTPAANKPRNRKKQTKEHPHPHHRSRSTPAILAPAKKPSKHSLDISYPGYSVGDGDSTYTRELIHPRNLINDTFELAPNRECLPTESSDDVSPTSPALVNIDLADSDVTLTVFNSDDSEYFTGPPARTKQLISNTNTRQRAPEEPEVMKLQQDISPSEEAVHNSIKADELMARNSQYRANLYYANKANTPLVKLQNERQGVEHSTQVDKAVVAARIPDKLSDNYSKSPMQPVKHSKEPVSILKNKNESQLNFTTSQPYSYSIPQQLDTIGEGRNSPVDLSEYRDRAYEYSQVESYIQPPGNTKKPIKKKIGDFVSKSITSKPKLTLSKPNFFKTKETKSTQISSDGSKPRELNLSYSGNPASYSPRVQEAPVLERTASAPHLHTSDFPETNTSRNSTGTQTFYETEPQSTQTSDQKYPQKFIPTKSPTINKTATIKSMAGIHALSDKLDRDYLYNASTTAALNKHAQQVYPNLSDSPDPICTMDQPYSTPTSLPEKPVPYSSKRDLTPTTPNTPPTNPRTLFTTETPNSFSNPYLDTSHTSHYTQPKPKQRDKTPDTDSFSLPTQSPNSFSTLLEEVNKSLPYELKLSDPVPSTPVTPTTPPPTLKHSCVPTPFVQAAISTTPTPPVSSQSLTPRSKRRVTIDPNPTDVQFCDEYDRTPVMPSLDPHISDDSDEAREEIIQELTSSPGAQGGGTYVHPPPYQGAPSPYSCQLFPAPSSETMDTTFDLDPSIWKDSPTYIGLDEYLQQQSEDEAPSLSSPLASPPPELLALTDQQLREELLKVGEQPGPITSITRTLYMRYLSKVKLDPTLQSSNCFQGYLYQLAQVLTGSKPIPNEQQAETDMCHYFDNPPSGCNWREGITKESFNYILIDPRVSQNLPSLIAELSELDRFRIFIESIFYVGKGKRSRPYSHLYEAINCERNRAQATPKQQRILDIWSSGHGVVSLHCFQGTIAVEALSREACLIEAIGLSKLTNTKRGEVYGVVGEWDVAKRRRVGIYLLHRAMHILIAEGERQICRENLTK